MSDLADEASAELELIDAIERKLLDLDRDIGGGSVDRGAVHSLFRNAHSLKGSLAMSGDEEAARLVHAAEAALDALRSGRLDASRALVDALLAGADGLRSRIEGRGAGNLAALAAAIAEAGEGGRGPEAGAPGGAGVALARELGFLLDDEEASALREEAGAGARLYLVEKLLDGRLGPEQVAALPVFDAVKGLGRTIAVRPAGAAAPRGQESLLSILFASRRSSDDIFLSIFDPCREIKVEEPRGGACVPAPADAAPAAGAGAPPGKEAPEGAGRRAARRELRVEASKLDKLFDLVGELITAEASLAACPEIADRSRRGLQKAFASISKITRELQETTMAVRMVPLEGLFDKMDRLARDLSRKTGKELDFVVSGGDREMDKNAIEAIADPLVHLVRNAVDHGIEGPEARRAAGKGERGRVELAARYEGSEVLISVSDDGSGIDVQAALRKATAKGLLPQGECARSPEDIVRELIFLPGFSTNEKATELSGRGVGLDVVKRNVERLRGRVELSWEPGAGTTFTLRMPMTLSIVEAMALRSGDCRYSIPVTDVREFFRPRPDQVLEAEGERVALRGEYLPLLRLDEVVAAAGGTDAGGGRGVTGRRPVEESIAVVVELGGRRACLLADEVLGAQQVVVRPMPAYAGRVGGLSGCSVNGDGSVGFILDTGRIMAGALGRGGRA